MQIARLIDTWVYDIEGRIQVLIVTYLCYPCAELKSAKLGHEHKELGFFGLEALGPLKLPAGYRKSILSALG